MKTLTLWLDEERGRRIALAASIGVVPSALSQWKQVPADRVLDVERLTGISRHDLRPDVFGDATPNPAPKREARVA